MATDSGEAINELLDFGLKPHQTRTLDQLLGQFFGQSIKIGGSPEVRKAQAAANKLIAGLKAHWDAALPKGQTRGEVLKSAFDALQKAKANGLNPSQAVRKQLFDGWRERFMKRLGADHALVAELKAATGIRILTDGDVPKFRLELKVGARKAEFGFDVDHAEKRLSDAVRSAKHPGDLLSVIESEGMQLLTPRENRNQIEALRKASREYFEKADIGAIEHFKRRGISKEALNADIDQVLEVLDRPGDFFP